MRDLIDTTEMYLKTIYELGEDGITPMRARIVERLGHSGPTVSQTIARMERDGLVIVEEDRTLTLTDEGEDMAVEVMRKHRLAERLLVDVIGFDWSLAHEEACRWEHVMSDRVEQRLKEILDCTKKDPYGNPVPGEWELPEGLISLADVHTTLAEGESKTAELARLGEPVQSEVGALSALDDIKMRPGDEISITLKDGELMLSQHGKSAKGKGSVAVPQWAEPHIFVQVSKQ
ncbi:metal-dependent transcriptional regulator [Gleimia europaea]|uniref:HTH dtxR-type domain-containing protein n=1 Tax=Gleimia europaea ACS-120-V-Col10b TaxID=883069 RepID=A0A9W5RFU2_9ACTO|nr:metal-dependent transcriptional regulator [Gleimia europaea]EPD31647.1 hypothetical protein HMPREF9238_01424 [Gleimia europaea ACS-120-V-Col10b]